MWQSRVENEHYSVSYLNCDIFELPLINSIKRNSNVLCKRSNYRRIYIARLSPALNRSSEIFRFQRGDAIEIRNRIMFVFYPGLPHSYSTNFCSLVVKP